MYKAIIFCVCKQFQITLFLLALSTSLSFVAPAFQTVAHAQESDTLKRQITEKVLLKTGAYFTAKRLIFSDGEMLDEHIINGPPEPLTGYELERASVALPKADVASGMNTLTVPAFNWVFGCSSVSGAMIAGFYDRNGYENMYVGPTNGGVMPLDNSSWPTWSDGFRTYPNLPLAASHYGVDGRTNRGSIDDYWVQYNSSDNDPYIGNWTEHSWSDAIGDYMKTSQSEYNNTDGSTAFYNFTSSASRLTCADMVSYDIHSVDGTYGRKLFYEARGYAVTDCYNQVTDNKISGGFSFAQFKVEIDAGRPVMLNLEGHTVVGVGYDDSSNTVYLHDTWDYSDHTMTWGGSYSGMELLSVSIVNLQATTTATLTGLTITGPTSMNENSSETYTATATWSDGSTTTASPSWSENSPYTTISSSGILSASSVSSNQLVTVSASYSSGGVTQTDTHNVTIMNVATITLGAALDNTSLQWVTGGNGEWFGQPSTTYYGGDAAQGGDIDHSEESYLQTTVIGPGTLSFYWKVSSENWYDYLRFYIDGTEQSGSISGSTGWAQKTFTLTFGSHVLKWAYTKDSSVSSGDDTGWVDKVVWTGSANITLGSALDTTDLVWFSGGDAAWFGQTGTAYYGGDAAQGGYIGDNQKTYLQTTVIGPGTLSFYWKVSSESNYDYLRFYIDGTEQSGSISGLTGWTPKVFTVPSGSHVLRWSYIKDGSISSGGDTGWVDKVSWTYSGKTQPLPWLMLLLK
ncbi:C39 family peptidase [Desulfogranum japonicum]|uniref:C39 family peptidase n=1 Tax=Desulfogranum japonicum TaxID=231447 RepID=UPI000412E43F|nr:C39 family peptidase [Desulfogranum japonicum]